jgi:hypothetical protein
VTGFLFPLVSKGFGVYTKERGSLESELFRASSSNAKRSLFSALVRHTLPFWTPIRIAGTLLMLIRERSGSVRSIGARLPRVVCFDGRSCNIGGIADEV